MGVDASEGIATGLAIDEGSVGMKGEVESAGRVTKLDFNFFHHVHGPLGANEGKIGALRFTREAGGFKEKAV